MILRVSDLRAGYGQVPVLHGISLEIERASIVGVLGHNGMGKTTLINALMGLIKTTSGEINFKGTDISGLPTHRRAQLGIGYVPQGRRIFPRLTVHENLKMGCASAADSRATIEEVLELFPRLKPLLARYGGVLSGGEQQLLAFARSLCGRPSLLLLDEPTEGIQPSIVDLLIETLLKLLQMRSLSVLLVEQNVDFLKSTCEKLLVLQKGLVVRKLDQSELGNESLATEFISGT